MTYNAFGASVSNCTRHRPHFSHIWAHINNRQKKGGNICESCAFLPFPGQNTSREVKRLLFTLQVPAPFRLLPYTRAEGREEEEEEGKEKIERQFPYLDSPMFHNLRLVHSVPK